MTDSKIIAHKGLIRAIEKGEAQVSLLDAEGCSGCAIKSTCGASNTTNKVIEVPVKAGTFSVGEIVELKISYRQGFIALFWAYFFPFIILLTGLVVFLSLNFTEAQAAIYSLLQLPVYYALLYFFNTFLSRKFQFKISKT